MKNLKNLLAKQLVQQPHKFLVMWHCKFLQHKLIS